MLCGGGLSARRQELLLIGAIFVVALIIRGLYLYLNSHGNPLFHHPSLDARFHHHWAIEILSGKFWGDEVFFRAPLYPYVLALIYKISGTSITVAVFLQHLAGSLTCVLIYVLSREFFAVRVSFVAGLLAALYWPFIYFEGELLIVTSIVLLDVVMLLALVLALRHDRLWIFLAAGIVMGLSAIARPSVLIFAPVLPIGLYLSGRTHGIAHRRWIRQTLIIATGACAIVVPVTVRNYVIGRDFVPIASQGGVNFYIGNNPASNGSLAQVPGARGDMYGTYRGAIELAEKDVGRSLKASEVSNYYFKKGVDFITSSPGAAAALTAKKLYLFWAGIERSNSKYIQFFWERFGLGKVPLPGFWLVGPMGLLGGVLLWRRRKELSLLYLFVLSYMVGVVVFFVNGRFRLPVAPVLIMFSGYSLCYLYTALRSRRGELVKALVILAVCVFVVDYDYVHFRGVRSFDEAVSHYDLGNAYLKTDRRKEALEAFENAHRIQQRYPTQGYLQIAAIVDYQLGVLYREEGMPARAVAAFERVPPGHNLAVAAHRELALLYEQAERFDDAIGAQRSVLSSAPRDVSALIGLARVYRRTGEAQSYDRVIAQLRAFYPGDRRVEARIRDLESAPRTP